MSVAPISAGDLVMVTRTCCDKFVRTPIFTVARIVVSEGGRYCCACSQDMFHRVWALDETVGPGDEEVFWYPLEWLKKLSDPLPAAKIQEPIHGRI